MSRDTTEEGRSVDTRAEESNHRTPDAAKNSKTENLKTVYDQLCDSYRAIDDIRMKLLGLLPIATGAGILVLTGGGKSGPASGLALPIGLFGLLVTIGLFSYELHGIKKCGYWIDAGTLIEKGLGIYGQFQRRPHELAGFIDEPFSASIIYPAVLASWLFFALLEAPRWVGYVSSSVVFLGGVWLSLHLIRAVEEDMKPVDEDMKVKEGKEKRKQYSKEKVYFRRKNFLQGLNLTLPDDAYSPAEADAGQRPDVTSEKSAVVSSP